MFSTELQFIKPVKFFEVSNEGGQFSDNNLGLCIDVPEGAVPQGTTLQLEVGVCLYGPFKFPSGLYPIAAILMLCSKNEVKLHKNLEITIPHYIIFDDIEASECLGIKVIKAGHRSLLLAGEYVFDNIIHGSNLSFHTRNGYNFATFSLQSFSFISLFANRDNYEVAKRRGYCICPLLPVSSTISSDSLTFFMCVTYFMSPCIEVGMMIVINSNLLNNFAFHGSGNPNNVFSETIYT